MNYIAVFVPNIIMLLSIWIPNYSFYVKICLTITIICKCIMDYDIAKPAHSGVMYTIVKKVAIEKQEFLVLLFVFVISIIYEVLAIYFNALIPSIFGGIQIVLLLLGLIAEIRDIIHMK